MGEAKKNRDSDGSKEGVQRQAVPAVSSQREMPHASCSGDRNRGNTPERF